MLSLAFSVAPFHLSLTPLALSTPAWLYRSVIDSFWLLPKLRPHVITGRYATSHRGKKRLVSGSALDIPVSVSPTKIQYSFVEQQILGIITLFFLFFFHGHCVSRRPCPSPGAWGGDRDSPSHSLPPAHPFTGFCQSIAILNLW